MLYAQDRERGMRTGCLSTGNVLAGADVLDGAGQASNERRDELRTCRLQNPS
jgi:hypothetical protein